MPNLQILPLLKLLESGAIEFKNLIEIGALLQGRKRVVRLVVPSHQVDITCQFFMYFYPDLSVRLSTFMLQDAFHMTSVDRFQRRVHFSKEVQGERVVLIGMKSGVDQAWEIEEGECTDEQTSEIYGYPACCGAAYQRVAQGYLWFEAFFEKEEPLHSFDMLSNRISSVVQPYLGYHFDYFPCSAQCAETLSINDLNRTMLLNSDLAEYAQYVDEHIYATVVLHHGCIWYVRASHLGGSNLVCRRVFEPVIRNYAGSPMLLKDLRIGSREAVACIDGKWLKTGLDDLRVHTFGSI